MVVCFVVGCKSGNNGAPKHLFRFPKQGSDNLKLQWSRNIPKRVGVDWNSTKSICHLHFEEKFIVKERTVIFNEKVIASEKRIRWTLTPDAVPTNFSMCNLPKYIHKVQTVRKAPKSRTEEPTMKTKKIKQSLPTIRCFVNQEEVNESQVVINLKSYDQLVKMKNAIQLPSESWILQFHPKEEYLLLTKLCTSGNSQLFWIERSIKVDGEFNVQVVLQGLTVNFFKTEISNATDLNELLIKVDTTELCLGVSHFEEISTCARAVKRLGKWFSNDCEILAPSLHCNSCLKLKRRLHVMLWRKNRSFDSTQKYRTLPAQTSEIKSYISRLKKNLANKTKQLQHTQKNLTKSLQILKKMDSEFKKKSAVSLYDAINNESRIPGNMKMAMIAAVKVAKAKSMRGRRYQSEWLLQCLLLRIKSTLAYKHLRDNQILPLPHPATLQSLIGSIPCQFGFTDFVFKELGKLYKDKPRRDKQVLVVFDEMKIKEGIEYDKMKMDFHGFIDYSEFTDHYLSKTKKTNRIANHALVFMARSLNSNWVQPLASFASRDAAPGSVLAKILLSCVLKLEACGLEVVGVISDGATTNKSVWNILGIKGDFGSVVNKIVHPCNDKRFLRFICDPVHIIKCVRNNFRTHGVKKFKGHVINWGFYEAVFHEDQNRLVRAIPKITSAHLNPNSFQKMRVYLATQLFSSSMADAIKFYRKYSKFLKNSEATEDFTRSMNNIFDALNCSHYPNVVKPNSSHYKTICDFITLLNENASDNDFASEVTMGSLRVTLQSIKEIVDYLTDEIGFAYVLTSKFNQDCIEKFFGLIRSMGGDENHPTVINFLHLYRLLSIYTPTAKTLRGNIRTSEECTVAITDYVQLLRTEKKSISTKSEIKKKYYGDKLLLKIVQHYETANIVFSDHDYCKVEASNCIMYQLAGYIAFRSKKLTKCNDCLNSLVVSHCDDSEAFLTNIKSRSKLKFPSQGLYRLLSDTLEPAIATNLHLSSVQAGNTINKIISSIDCLPTGIVGCNYADHSSTLLIQIVIYYITVRLYFYTKTINRNYLSSGIACKSKMKEAKLL